MALFLLGLLLSVHYSYLLSGSIRGFGYNSSATFRMALIHGVQWTACSLGMLVKHCVVSHRNLPYYC